MQIFLESHGIISICNRINDIKEIGKNPYNRIIMEKEKQGLSYTDLCDMLKSHFNTDIDYENLRKKLTGGRKANPKLLKELNAVLGIQTELDTNEAVAVYYYMKNRPKHTGHPSESDRNRQQIIYNEAQQRKSTPECGAYSLDELLLNFFDSEEELEYYERLNEEREHNKEIALLKHALLIYREMPNLFDEIFSNFIFDEQDKAKLNHLRIEFYE